MAYSCASCLFAAVASQSMARMSRTPQYFCAEQSRLNHLLPAKMTAIGNLACWCIWLLPQI